MSTFVNTTTNITAPLGSCRYLAPTSPLTNDSNVACSVPDCGNNRAAIEKCCGAGSITPFHNTYNVLRENITINAKYLTCTLAATVPSNFSVSDYDPSEPAYALPDCIVREGGSRLVCNRPNSQFKGCLGIFSHSPAQGTGTGFATCGGNSENENVTALIRTCCQNSNGTLRAEQEGCGISCSGDESLEPCVKDGFSFSKSQPRGGAGPGCSNHSRNSNGSAATVGGSGQTTLANVLLAAVVAMAILQQ